MDYKFNRRNDGWDWGPWIGLFASSLIPIYSMNYVKKPHLRILFGVLIVPLYIFLILVWLFIFGFVFLGESL